MIQHFHNILLVHDNIFFVIFEYKIFVNNLHGIEFPIPFESTKINFRETSSSKTTNDIETL